MYEGQVDAPKMINLLFDDEEKSDKQSYGSISYTVRV
jgi:hypothetical protein